MVSRNVAQHTPLMFAAYMEREEILSFISSRQETFNFFEVCVIGNDQKVRHFLRLGQDINEHAADGFTALGLAVFFRQKIVARLLIDSGADVNLVADNDFHVAPIHAAVARHDVAMIEILLLQGADPNKEQQKRVRPLHDAAASGQTVSIALLLMFGAELDAETEEGETAMTLASLEGHKALAQRLRELTFLRGISAKS